MPRRNKGYQLDYYTPKGYGEKQWVVFWYERGTRRERATGLTDSKRLDQAEEWRAKFAADRERPSGPAKPDGMTVAQALEYYAKEHAPSVVDKARIGHAIKALLPFWGHQPVSAIKGETCRRYVRERGKKPNTVRRELSTLNAALQHCHREGYLLEPPAVWLPEGDQGRDRWLTRSEAAALLRAARSEEKARLHLPTFILLGLYTGHRSEAILSLQWQPNMTGGYVDIETGRIDFNPIGRKKTKKRRGHIPIPAGLLIHLRHVRARTRQYVIESEGLPIKSCKRSFATACRNAKVKDVVRHTLRHTACTWFMHRGVDPELASAYVAMDPETFRKKYMHHHPDYMKTVTDSFRKSPSLSPS
jgi:integrase